MAYEYRLLDSTDWVEVPDADYKEVTAAGGYLVFFNEDDEEISVVRNWNEVRVINES